MQTETPTETTTKPATPRQPIHEKAGALAERKARSAVATRQTGAGASTDTLVGALIKAASDPNIDVQRMLQIKSMYDDIAAKAAEREYLDALSRCQASLEPVRKALKNDHTGSMFASLASVQREVMPKAAAEGLSFSIIGTERLDGGWIRVTAELAHRSGHKKQYFRDSPVDMAGAKGTVNKTEIQGIQATVTFVTRGLYKQAFALAEEGDDKDGNAPPTPAAKLTAAHQKAIREKAEKCGPSILGNVLREYKTTALEEIPDSEFATIDTILDNMLAKRTKAAAGAK